MKVEAFSALEGNERPGYERGQKLATLEMEPNAVPRKGEFLSCDGHGAIIQEVMWSYDEEGNLWAISIGI